MIEKLKRLFKIIYLDKLLLSLKKLYYSIIHSVFLFFMGKGDFKIKFQGFPIVVFNTNYFKYINKPVWIRLLDNSYEKQEIKAIKHI